MRSNAIAIVLIVVTTVTLCRLWFRWLVKRKFQKTLASLRSTAASSPRELRILSYNVFIRPPLVSSHGNDYKLERLSLLLEELADNSHGFDVVCLQELFPLGSPWRDEFVAATKRLGFFHSVSLPLGIDAVGFCPPKILSGGCTILSRYPMVDTDSLIYSDSLMCSIDAVVAKGVLYALIRLPSSELLHVFTTHMQAGDGREGHIVRMRQLDQALDFIRRKLEIAPGSSAVLCGDFNINSRTGATDGSSSAEWCETMERLNGSEPSDHRWMDLILTDHSTHLVTSGDAIEAPDGSILVRELQLGGTSGRGCRKCLDYILFRRGSSPSSLLHMPGSSRVEPFHVELESPFVQLSDHYGVACVLREATSSGRFSREPSVSGSG
mmetsp:Transcript_3816/g.7287  ORF Transcript_3816/g.7287 Transcript_3816/m.7287 type:complete len:381 (-) Transcript_3816:2087-3229(-)